MSNNQAVASKPHKTAPHASKFRFPWVPLTFALLLPAPFLLVSGFFLGTIQGDIPFPATEQESFVYYTARLFAWFGLGTALIASAAALLGSPIRPIARLGRALLTLLVASVAGIIVFFIAFSYGANDFLGAFT